MPPASRGRRARSTLQINRLAGLLASVAFAAAGPALAMPASVPLPTGGDIELQPLPLPDVAADAAAAAEVDGAARTSPALVPDVGDGAMAGLDAGPAGDPAVIESVDAEPAVGAAAEPGAAGVDVLETVPATAPELAGESAAAEPAAPSQPALHVEAPGAADEVLSVPPESTGPPELDPAANPASIAFIGPRLMPAFRILGQEVPSGAKARLEWSASQSFAGAEVLSPVVVVHGVRPGPVLCLTGAVHGDELNGVEIVRRLARTIDPQQLSGTVIAVPIVNLFGFSRNSRYLPDRRDLNRFFPGSERGSIASRIAHSFFSQVVRHCEALVDFHTGSFDRANLPQVRADLRLPEVLRFARGFGAVPVLHSNGSRGMLRLAASQVGIPSVTFEVGAPAVLEPVEIAAGVRAIEALMHHMTMTTTAPGEQEPQAIFYDSVWVRANAGGMLIGAVDLGERVTPGQRLGSVVDPINDIERDIVSPVYGRVIGMARNQVVLPGFAAYHVGEETSEARAVREAAASRAADDPVEEDPDPREHGDGEDNGEPVDDE